MPSNESKETDLVPVAGPGAALTPLGAPAPPAPFGSLEPEEGLNWRRILAVLVRYKWLLLVVTLAGTAAGVGATRFLDPTYQASATLWVEVTDRPGRGGGGNPGGPIRQGQLLESIGWADLLKSYVVLDHVVGDLRLYLTLQSPADSVGFSTFQLQQRFRPGRHRLEVDGAGQQFTLSSKDQVSQQGQVGDSVGTAIGFRWVPPAGFLQPGRTIEFAVTTPRDAAQRLADNLTARIDRDGNFMRLTLLGTNPGLMASTLNRVLDRYVTVAAQLKREKLSELTRILDEQLRLAERNLTNAENTFESFRVRTITLPSEPATPVAPGIAAPQDPAVANFLGMKVEREQLRRDRQAIERALTQAGDSGVSVDALVVVAAVRGSPAISQALNELTTKQASLRSMRNTYTEDYPPLRRLQEEVQALHLRTIPDLARALIDEIQNRENELENLVRSATRELQQIPPRAIEEARLRRNVAVAENLYTTLQSRYEEARLAEASSIPDVRILDAAVVPQRPVKDTAPRIILVAFLGSLGLAVLGAVVLDRMDSRLRYPEQVSRGMGLTILGAVPHIGGRNGVKTDDTGHVVEALRGIRLSLAHAHGAAGPLLVTITSPGSGDGKSFIASNLALAFADNGHRTLLIDGDVRRGTLHRVLNAARKPGLTDFLSGQATREQVLRPTSYPGVTLIGCGTRTREGPQLLGSAAMSQLVMTLRSSFDVILIDSPPLGAGVDPFVLSTVTGNLLMVLRTGYTDRELTEAKLDVLDRLPVRILGAVLNDVSRAGAYRYYSYCIAGYEAEDEGEEVGAGGKLPSGKSAERA